MRRGAHKRVRTFGHLFERVCTLGRSWPKARKGSHFAVKLWRDRAFVHLSAWTRKGSHFTAQTSSSKKTKKWPSILLRSAFITLPWNCKFLVDHGWWHFWNKFGQKGFEVLRGTTHPGKKFGRVRTFAHNLARTFQMVR